MVKNLRAKKSIETETLKTLTSYAKNTLRESVQKQFSAMALLPPECRHIYSEINSASFSVLRTGHRLDEYSNALSGYVPTTKVMELGTLLAMLCERAQPFFRKKDILLRCKISKEKLYAKIEVESFYYAVLEILLNALEYSIPHSQVTVKLTGTKKYIKLEIKDHGCGMNEEAKSRCFEPFFSTKKDKLGLGLALVQNFVKNIGGRVSVSSEESKGTCVALLLPKAEIDTLRVESPSINMFDVTVTPVEIMLG